MGDFTHFDENGRCRMVDVSEKNDTARIAVAEGYIYVNPETFALIVSGGIKKGDVLTVAQIAGIMGAKRTSELIPMCHPLENSGYREKPRSHRSGDGGSYRCIGGGAHGI